MVEWSITTDCKSVTLWVTKVRILLCAPIKNDSRHVAVFIRGIDVGTVD